MANFTPKSAGPRTRREHFWHWWNELKRVGKVLGDTDTTPPDPAPSPPTTPTPPQPPGSHSHWLGNLIDVTIDDPKHNQSLVFDGETLNQWVNGEAQWQLSEANPTGLVEGGELNISNKTGELVTNGTFDASIAGWSPFSTSVFEWVAGTARGVRNEETVAETTLTTPVQVGKQYKLTFDIVASSNTSNGYIYFRLGSSIGPTTHRTIGTHEWVFTALSNTDFLEIRAGGVVGLDFQVDNISLIGVEEIEVIAGLGLIMDSYTVPDSRPVIQAIQWPQINEAITAAPAVAGSIVHLTIYDTGVASQPINGRPVNEGALRQYALPPDEPTRRDEIYLGWVVHNGDGWGEISSPIVVNNAAHTLTEFLKRVAGPTFVIDGGQVTEAPSFTIDQDGGTVWEHNRNWHVNKKNPHREALPPTTGLQWKYVNRDFSDVGAATGTVDPSQWDDGGTVSAVPGASNSATVQILYQDPRDNYWVLWGQNVFDNAQEAAASIQAPTVVPELLQTSVLLAYIVVEKGKSDWDEDEAFLIYPQGGSGIGGGSVPITTYLGLADTPGAYAGDRRKVVAVDENEVALGHDYRTKLLPYVNGQEYYPQETVFEEGWLMSANTITTDYPAPQAVGDPVYALPDAPAFQEFSSNSVVASGHLYTFTVSGYFRALRVWVPETGPDITYRITGVRNPNGANPTYTIFDSPLLLPNQWNTLAASTILTFAGEEFVVYIEAVNSGTSVSPGGTPADWIYQGTDNTTPPTTGGWNTNVQQNLLRIHEDTADAALVDLTGVIPGSTFQFVDVNDPNTSIEFTALSNETYDAVNSVYSWTVVISSTGSAGAPALNNRTLTTILVPVPAATKFNGIPAYWDGTTMPTWATVASFLEYDGVPQAVAGDEAYGVDIAFQELTKSDDWDVYGVPSGGGGSGDARSDSNLLPVLVKTIQELAARVEALEA